MTETSAEEALVSRLQQFRKALICWYDAEHRELPWRNTRDPYAIWVSEVMLQQTRVDTVLPYYDRFLARFPTLVHLADAKQDDVLALWSGLGYYRRARMLQKGAIHVRDCHGGVFPKNLPDIGNIPGVGPYTQGAIGSFAFELQAPLVDGNVTRVLARLDAMQADVGTSQAKKQLWERAAQLVVGDRPDTFNNALMELGATVCTPTSPSCGRCPIAFGCEGYRQGIAASLPRKAKKAAVPTVSQRVWVLSNPNGDGTILFGQNGAGGLFSGLWEPPRTSADTDLSSMTTNAPVLRGKFEHVLTHRRLAIEVMAGELAGRLTKTSQPSTSDNLSLSNSHHITLPSIGTYIAYQFADPNKPPGGVSTLVRKALRLIAQHP